MMCFCVLVCVCDVVCMVGVIFCREEERRRWNLLLLVAKDQGGAWNGEELLSEKIRRDRL